MTPHRGQGAVASDPPPPPAAPHRTTGHAVRTQLRKVLVGNAAPTSRSGRAQASALPTSPRLSEIGGCEVKFKKYAASLKGSACPSVTEARLRHHRKIPSRSELVGFTWWLEHTALRTVSPENVRLGRSSALRVPKSRFIHETKTRWENGAGLVRSRNPDGDPPHASVTAFFSSPPASRGHAIICATENIAEVPI